MHAGFFDPGGPSRVGQSGWLPYSLADSVLPYASVTASASTMIRISGFILLSSHFPLSTLRDRVTPVVTQDSLPAGDLSLAGQGSNLQGSYRWFLHLLLHLLPPSPGLSWRTADFDPPDQHLEHAPTRDQRNKRN